MTDLLTTLNINNFEVAYGEQIALSIPSLSLTGKVFAVIGHNGAGKSTLLKAMLELLPLKTGELSLTQHGKKLTPSSHMAFCPETGAVFGDITVESYLRFWCRVKRGNPEYFNREGSRILELLELNKLLPKLGRELSKGQRRRVQTAAGFLISPKLFLFDEPFDGLDVQKSHELAELLGGQSENMSLVISSHRMDVVERLADCIIVLREGRVAAAGSRDEVVRALCSQSFKIINASDPSKLLEELRTAYPEMLVRRIGDELSISGEGITQSALSSLVNGVDLNGAQITSVTPSLVEAMSYHLQHVSKVSANRQ